MTTVCRGCCIRMSGLASRKYEIFLLARRTPVRLNPASAIYTALVNRLVTPHAGRNEARRARRAAAAMLCVRETRWLPRVKRE